MSSVTSYQAPCQQFMFATLMAPMGAMLEIAKMSGDKVNQHKAHYLWVIPTALALNLITSAFFVVAAAVSLVASPVFAALARCHSNDAGKKAFYLMMATMSVTAVRMGFLSPATALVSSFAPHATGPLLGALASP